MLATTTPARTQYFSGLNPLRAFAALSVLVFHVTGMDGFAEVPANGPLSWIRGGWVGLDIFFVTSGLVVGQSAIAGYLKLGTHFRNRFVLHRLARIVPLFLFTGTVCAIFFSKFSAQDTIRQVLSHLVFIHNLWMDTTMAINPPSWSLAVEMQLYLLLLLLTPWLAQKSPTKVALSCVGVALLYRSIVYFGVMRMDPTNTSLLQHLTYQTPGMIDSFGLGVAAAIATVNRRLTEAGPALCSILIVLGLCALTLGSVVTPQFADATIWSKPWLAIGVRTCIAFAALALVMGCALMPISNKTVLGQLMHHAGDLSYGVYLWHFAVLSAVMRLTSLSSWSLVAVVILFTVAAAEITWRLIERPVLRWAAARG